MDKPFTDHRTAARALLAIEALAEKEGQFCGGLAYRTAPLSDKQVNWLRILLTNQPAAHPAIPYLSQMLAPWLTPTGPAQPHQSGGRTAGERGADAYLAAAARQHAASMHAVRQVHSTKTTVANTHHTPIHVTVNGDVKNPHQVGERVANSVNHHLKKRRLAPHANTGLN